MHAAELLWMGTCGSARALRLDGEIGNIAKGHIADLVAINLASTPAISQRHTKAFDIWGAVFATIMMGDDRAIAQVWVAGDPYKDAI